ncbi:ABC transporter ATP-binding protein [Clostridia bacterium]|nr:ABC transporter ATP-binding protein [Clostridia bacterium]
MQAAHITPPLLQVEDLEVRFQGKTETVYAVNGVSFNVYSGETFGLVGESGCGKSQTCRSILRLIKPPGRITGGHIRYQGEDLIALSDRAMRRVRGREISVIFQEPMTSLNPVMKIRKQIYEVFDGMNLSEEEKERRALELMNQVGIPDPKARLDEYAHQYSGGMRQRVMIAIALGARPKLLLADEPTTALDVTIQDQIMKLINKLKSELSMSMILVTHDLAVIAQMCDRVAVMYAGLVVEMTDTMTLFSHPRHPYTYALMKSLPNKASSGAVSGGTQSVDPLETIEGAPPNLSSPIPGCPFAPRCRYAKPLCVAQRPPLADVMYGHAARCHFPEVTETFRGILDQ